MTPVNSRTGKWARKEPAVPLNKALVFEAILGAMLDSAWAQPNTPIPELTYSSTTPRDATTIKFVLSFPGKTTSPIFSKYFALRGLHALPRRMLRKNCFDAADLWISGYNQTGDLVNVADGELIKGRRLISKVPTN